MNIRPHRTAAALFAGALVVAVAGSSNATVGTGAAEPESPELAAFRAAAGEQVSTVTIELRTPRTSVRQAADGDAAQALMRVRESRLAQQDAFIATLATRGVRLLPAQLDATQPDGRRQRIQFRYTQVLNGFSAHVANSDIERLRQMPEVQSVTIEQPVRVHLNQAVDYALGTDFNPSDRRLAVYGGNEEMLPAGSAGHPETPKTTTIDGFEGQGIVLSVIDTGVDWKHPMFGGTGHTSANPQTPPAAPAPEDNKKVTYLVNFSVGDPGDDYGHGTFVASNSAGYRVDGTTLPNLGYGTGQDGTGVGPTPGSTVLHGIAPQATIMGYKTLSAAGTGVNNSTQLALDDSVSPCVSAVQTAGCVNKPIADVINMSLGGGGSASSASTRSANNAALAGAGVVASAGNSGPGASTVGAPCMGSLVICIGASLDPGSISAGAILAPNQIPGETHAGKTPGEGAGPGPAKETGAASQANAPQPNTRQAMRLFRAAGGGPLPGNSVSAHYVYADMRPDQGNNAPTTVTNRIALVRGTGAFAGIANSVAPLQPAAILIITTVESATAVAVIGGIPTYTIGINDSNYLIDLMRTGDAGDGDDNVHVPHGTVSELPMRLDDSVALDNFVPGMAGFSSRGPNSVAGSDYRNIKPDVTAPGAGILAAATPDGNPNVSGMGEPSGYIIASGTSFSGPISAGAAVLLRQRVREQLGFDTINLADPQYRNKRFEAATIVRALLQNNATNLRTGRGVAEVDGSDSTTIHDLGSGHINIAAALSAQAIMVAPTKLLGNGVEFNMPALNPPTLDANGNLDVLLPTHSFGQVGVAGAPATVSKTVKVLIRDITNGGGAGTYDLSFQNDVNMDQAGVGVDFLAADGETPVSSVSVPTGGIGEYFVRISVDGTQYALPNTDLLWYVTAQHTGSGRSLRMPFYLRATQYVSPLVTAAPVQAVPTGLENPATPPACGTDTDAAYTLNFSYTIPNGGDTPLGFRIQEGTSASAIFSDAPDEDLVAGENSKWIGSPQWNTSVNPMTGNPAYYIPDGAAQNEALTMKQGVDLPASATLQFDTYQETEADFDFAIVELVVGTSTVELGTFSGQFIGTRSFDLSPWAGQSAKVQFRLTSDDVVSAPGWYIENIRIEADDFVTIAETGASATTHAITGRNNGTRFYRIAGLFSDSGVTVAGPFSNLQCVTINVPNLRPIADAGPNASVNEGSAVTLDGTGSTDPENGVLEYSWAQTVGPTVTLVNADTAQPGFTAPMVTANTPLTFELTVTDVGGESATATVEITVVDVPNAPIADAGANQTVDERTLVVLDGSGSSEPDGDELSFEWVQVSGPAVTLTDSSAATTGFTAPSVGRDAALVFALTVRDPGGLEDTAQVTVTVRDVDGVTRILGGAFTAPGLLLLGLLGRMLRRRGFQTSRKE